MSSKIVIDLTEIIANAGKQLPFKGEYLLDSALLSYPQSELKKVAVDFSVTFIDPNVRVSGIITCSVNGVCDRCLEKVEKQIELNFDQIFFRDRAEYDDGYVYTNSKLDATKAVSDEIILSMPSSFLCGDDCKGLCPKCGANLNFEPCDCDTTKENVFSALKDLKF